jgi:hypothetical protein
MVKRIAKRAPRGLKQVFSEERDRAITSLSGFRDVIKTLSRVPPVEEKYTILQMLKDLNLKEESAEEVPYTLYDVKRSMIRDCGKSIEGQMRKVEFITDLGRPDQLKYAKENLSPNGILRIDKYTTYRVSDEWAKVVADELRLIIEDIATTRENLKYQ